MIEIINYMHLRISNLYLVFWFFWQLVKYSDRNIHFSWTCSRLYTWISIGSIYW